MLFLVGGFIGPVAEEMLFRGLVYNYLRRWGFWAALALSTLVFTVPHAGASGVPMPQIVGGLVFATAYEIEKNLLAPITIHVLGNLALFGLPYVFRRDKTNRFFCARWPDRRSGSQPPFPGPRAARACFSRLRIRP